MKRLVLLVFGAVTGARGRSRAGGGDFGSDAAELAEGPDARQRGDEECEDVDASGSLTHRARMIQAGRQRHSGENSAEGSAYSRRLEVGFADVTASDLVIAAPRQG